MGHVRTECIAYSNDGDLQSMKMYFTKGKQGTVLKYNWSAVHSPWPQLATGFTSLLRTVFNLEDLWFEY